MQNNSKQNTAAISDEYLNTYAKTKQALEMLSTRLDRGTNKLNSLNTLSQSLQRGKQNNKTQNEKEQRSTRGEKHRAPPDGLDR